MEIRFKKGAADWITFTYTEIIANVKTAIDMTGNTFGFLVSEKAGEGSPVITKVHADFNIDDIATGVVKVNITSANSTQEIKTYVSQITRTISATQVQPSDNIPFIIEPAVEA